MKDWQNKYKDKTEVNKEILAHKFSEIFELDYAETLEKLNTKTSSFKIVEKVDHEKIVSLQNWLYTCLHFEVVLYLFPIPL